MMCKIYRSDTKSGLYIYLAKGNGISDLPEDLIKLIGKYTLAMEIDLNTLKKLANENIENVRINLCADGYHLQLPTNITKNLIAYNNEIKKQI